MEYDQDGELTISKLETFTTTYLSVVRLTMNDGSQGWGQMSTYCADISSQIFHRQVAPHVLNRKFKDFKDLEDFVLEREHKFPGSYLLRALAGLDTALWDWLGKKNQLPVTCLLGSTPREVAVYGSSMKRDIQPKDEAMRLCRLRDEFGFSAFKFRVGAECGRGKDEWQGRSEQIIREVPKALGTNIIKMVDGNSCYSAAQAIELGKQMEDNGICHFEEPCPYWLPDETLKVTKALSIDVAGGEQDCDFRVWRDMINRKIVNVVQPDIMYMGGVTRCLEVAKMAKASELLCLPHAANLSLVTICTMHFLNAIENSGKFLEFSIEGEDYYPWQIGLFSDNPFKVDDGKVRISEEPGWGVEFNLSWLENADYSVSGSY